MKKVALLKKVAARDKSARVLMKLNQLNKQAALQKRADWMEIFKNWIGDANNQKKLMYGAGTALGTYALSGLLPNSHKHKGARAAGALAAGLGVGAYGDKIHQGLTNLWNTGSWSGAKAPAAAATAPAPAAGPAAADAAKKPAEAAKKPADVAKKPGKTLEDKKPTAVKAAPKNQPGQLTPAQRESQEQAARMVYEDPAKTKELNSNYDAAVAKSQQDVDAAGRAAYENSQKNNTGIMSAAEQAEYNNIVDRGRHNTQAELKERDLLLNRMRADNGELTGDARRKFEETWSNTKQQQRDRLQAIADRAKRHNVALAKADKAESDARTATETANAKAIENANSVYAADLAKHRKATTRDITTRDSRESDAYWKNEHKMQRQTQAGIDAEIAAENKRQAAANAVIERGDRLADIADKLRKRMKGSLRAHNGISNSSIEELGDELRQYSPEERRIILQNMQAGANAADREFYQQELAKAQDHRWANDAYKKSMQHDYSNYARYNSQQRVEDFKKALRRAGDTAPTNIDADFEEDFE